MNRNDFFDIYRDVEIPTGNIRVWGGLIEKGDRFLNLKEYQMGKIMWENTEEYGIDIEANFDVLIRPVAKTKKTPTTGEYVEEGEVDGF